MFDFTIAAGPPVTVITINGTQYTLPHFLLPAMNQWAAERRKAITDEAVSRFKDANDQARFLMYFQTPLVDIADVAPWATSTEGAPVLFRRQAKAAGVPDDMIEAVITQTDPTIMRSLAKELCSAQIASDGSVAMTEPSADPLPAQPAESPDSAGTGPKSTQDSAQDTPEPTPAS